MNRRDFMNNAIQAIAFAALPAVAIGTIPEMQSPSDNIWGAPEGDPFNPGYRYGNCVVIVSGDPGQVTNKAVANMLYKDMAHFIPHSHRGNVYVHGTLVNEGQGFMLCWVYEPE